MKSIFFLVAVFFRTSIAADTFNYGETQGTDYGLKDWDQVSCGDLETCVSKKDVNLHDIEKCFFHGLFFFMYKTLKN